MNALIYQCWDGPERPGNLAGIKATKEYAERIGVNHVYEHDTKFRTDLGSYSANFGKFRPIFDKEFEIYDYVMYTDCDVIPTKDCSENIFEWFATTGAEVGICEEWNAPLSRKKYTIGGGINNENDEKWVSIIEKKWPVKMPRTESGLPKVYNTGVLMFSRECLIKARETMFDFAKYVNLTQVFKLPPFYGCDQPYFHAMLEVCKFNWITMPYKWNSSVHFDPGVKTKPRPVIDLRKDANFVHVQLNGADHWDEEKILRVVNKPVSEWDL